MDYSFSFDQYLAEHGKEYNGPERTRREALFKASLAKIQEHNEAEHSWKMGLSEHSDKSESEIQALKGLHRGLLAAQRFRPRHDDHRMVTVRLPAELDWRTENIVTPVKNQGGCGSCWAFSATETLESALAKAGGPLLELAPQELVSCAPNPKECGGTGGCQGSTQASQLSCAMHYPLGGACMLACIDIVGARVQLHCDGRHGVRFQVQIYSEHGDVRHGKEQEPSDGHQGVCF